ncbi:MAG: cation:proton antiporter, partial [Candidatus Micrarchaeota archaeon]|nr:cation:proton antiporter [Candidatus Micrarchaeota archaeon]
IIGLAALLYALCSLFGGNGVVAVFAFAFMVGNSKGASTDEVRRFQSEISFFLRTFFFIYLGALLFHSPKPLEMGLFALCISLLFAVARMMAGKVLLLLEPSAREVRVADLVSSRGLTVAVLSIIAYDELLKLNPNMSFDLPLLALFVIFFTNAISAYLLMAKGRKRER